ncbi:hypothetical protein [Staphylococcus warneri]|uniref:hypothetical protein n=1 Tax=Staphylococcus warneri TaxID=1292 RepID=UPI001A8EA576|nr:hypothetical protein [Staphylococcus warneri]MBO0377061.1 hypothetical protein [Staphylococcus warneri]
MTKNSLNYKNKWLKPHIEMNINKGLTFYVTLAENKSEWASVDGFVKMDIDLEINECYIREIVLETQNQGQNYGFAMFKVLFEMLYQYYKDNAIEFQDIKVKGGIEKLYMMNNDTKSKQIYESIKWFYEALGFEFKDEKNYEKHFDTLEYLKLYNTNLAQYIELRDAKVDLAIQEQLLHDYEEEVQRFKSNMIGRLIIQILRKSNK